MWTTWTKVQAMLVLRHREKVLQPYCYWNGSCFPVYIFILRSVSTIDTRSLQFSMLTYCSYITSIRKKVMLTLLYILMTIICKIVFFLHKTSIGQFNVITTISHNTKPAKSYKNMSTWLIVILKLFPISICQQKNLHITYCHGDSHYCYINMNVRVVVDVRKSSVDMTNGIAIIVDMNFYLIWHSISHIECELMFWDAIWNRADVFCLHINIPFFLFYLIWIFFFYIKLLSTWRFIWLVAFFLLFTNFHFHCGYFKFNSDMTLWHVGINTSYVA